MKLLFFTSLAVVLYTYAGYPCFMALLSRLRPSPWTRGVVQGAASVILPVHNGMALLPWKIRSLCSMAQAAVQQILVVLDGADPAAEAWLATCNDPRLQVAVLPQQAGKAAALRRGMELATSEFLLFLDIRPECTEAAIRQLLSNFADPQVGCVAGDLQVQPASQGAASSIGGLYWRYEQWIRTCESAFDSPVGVYGGFYAVRRALAVPPPHGIILDDMFQPLWIIRQGYRSVVDVHATVNDRWPGTNSGEFQRKVRTLAGNFQLCAQAPWILTAKNRVLFQLVSHKLLRLVVPYCLAGMLVSACVLALHSRAWTGIAVLQILAVLAGLAGSGMRLPLLRKLTSALGALLLLNAAAVWALWTYIVTPGPLWKIWKPTPAPTQDASTL